MRFFFFFCDSPPSLSELDEEDDDEELLEDDEEAEPDFLFSSFSVSFFFFLLELEKFCVEEMKFYCGIKPVPFPNTFYTSCVALYTRRELNVNSMTRFLLTPRDV